MPNEETDIPKQEKHAAKSCCLRSLTVVLAVFFLILSALAAIIIADTIQLRGERMTLSKRAERYKVAAQFIWVDFTSWVSKRFSDMPPQKNEPPSESEPPQENEPTSEDAHAL